MWRWREKGGAADRVLVEKQLIGIFSDKFLLQLSAKKQVNILKKSNFPSSGQQYNLILPLASAKESKSHTHQEGAGEPNKNPELVQRQQWFEQHLGLKTTTEATTIRQRGGINRSGGDWGMGNRCGVLRAGSRRRSARSSGGKSVLNQHVDPSTVGTHLGNKL